MQRLIYGLFALALLWAVGLAGFIAGLPQAVSGAPAAGDGVIVYTGGGGARIEAGMSVFADGVGNRLLISGVHPDTSRGRISEFWRGAPEKFECCVDLGWQARSTEGNAEETAEWAVKNEFRGLVLVTSDYHMPRAAAITRARLPDRHITLYPVASGFLDEQGRPASRQAWRHLAGEYTKYLLARAKLFFLSFTR